MKNLLPAELKKWLEEGVSFQLIDVREPWEHEAYNIGGTLIPMGDLMARRDEIKQGMPAVLYCEKGVRSVIAIQRLESMGYTALYNLEGGMSYWKKQA